MESSRAPDRGKLVVFFVLFAAQTFPLAFFTVVVPPILRLGGVPLEKIGLFSILTLIVLLKSVFAPIVEKFNRGPFGPLKTWIYGAQLCTIGATAWMGFVEPVSQVDLLFLVAAVWMVCANIQDIGVDALTVRSFTRAQHSTVSTLAIFSGQASAIIAGFVIVQIVLATNFQIGVALVTAFLFLPFLLLRTIKEPPPVKHTIAVPTWRDYTATFERKGLSRWIWSVFFLTFAFGLTNPMRDPLLVDRGFSLDELSRFNGLVAPLIGMVAVVTMPFVFRYFKAPKLLTIALWIIIVQAVAFLAVVAGPMPKSYVYALTAVGSFAATYLFVAFGAIHLSLARPSRAAVDIATFATFPAFASAVSGVLGGILAGALGYEVLFYGSLVLKIAAVVVLVRKLEVEQHYSTEPRGDEVGEAPVPATS